MHYTNKYPEYPVIEDQIRRANIKRVVAVADKLAGFVLNAWHALQAPPAPAAIIIDRRREWRGPEGRRFAQR
jgi:hypothetical protein